MENSIRFVSNLISTHLEPLLIPLFRVTATVTPTEVHNSKVAENRLSTQVLEIVEHFKQADPVGIPGAPVPEPMVVPEIKHSFAMGNMKMTNVSIFGLSKFRIKYSKIDLNSLRATAIVHLEKMLMKGTYTLSAMFTTRYSY